MRNLLVASLSLLTAITVQSADAKNPFKNVITTQQHHSGNGSALQIGSYIPICNSGPEFIGGSAVADSRNIVVNGHNRQVLHLKGQGSASALAFVNNLDTVNTVVYSPINFTLEQGDGRYLLVNVGYIPHGGTQQDLVVLNLVTPDTALGSILTDETLTRMVSVGHGKYVIPIGSAGIPQGATLTFFSFGQLANPQDCSDQFSDIDELLINRQFIGISTEGGGSCTNPCGQGSGSRVF